MDNSKSIVTRFIQSATESPDSTALTVQYVKYSYSQILSMAYAFSKKLAKSDNPLCVLFIDNTINRYVGILAALMANKTYVPMLPQFSKDRIAMILEQIGTFDAIIDSKEQDKVELVQQNLSGEAIVLDTNGIKKIDVEPVDGKDVVFETVNLQAVMLFTSGSTGTPKGIVLTHANIQCYLDNVIRELTPGAEDVFSHSTNYSSDLHVHDLFVAWSVGASACVLHRQNDGGTVLELKANRISYALFVPAVINGLKADGFMVPKSFPDMKVTLFAGEPLSHKLSQYWSILAPNTDIYNFYGPSEATVVFTYAKWSPTQQEAVVPIGKPFADGHAMVLDEQQNSCAEGEVGELYLAGPQVVNGYFNDEAKTQSSFVKFEGSDLIWYRTGDLASWQESFGLMFHGRSDDRLKIRGHRIERLDLEMNLRKATGLTQLAALPISKDNFCMDFILFTSTMEGATEQEIKEKCKGALCGFMCPGKVVELDLPRTANSKIDYVSLKKLVVEQYLDGTTDE